MYIHVIISYTATVLSGPYLLVLIRAAGPYLALLGWTAVVWLRKGIHTVLMYMRATYEVAGLAAIECQVTKGRFSEDHEQGKTELLNIKHLAMDSM